MGVENCTTPYGGGLVKNYYFCPNHSIETFFVELIICYFVSKKQSNTLFYLLWMGKISNFHAFIVSFLQVYMNINLHTPEKTIFFPSKNTYILN